MEGWRRVARWCLALVVAVSILAMIWPGFALFADRTYPFIFGLPFSLAWHVIWLVVGFLAVLLYHVMTGEEG